MAEYYPLLAKAVGSLPNSTPETRRVVYERARKALIGQLRTLHPPVADEDIEHESVELDRAIERLETELAAAPLATPSAASSGVTPTPAAPPLAAPPPVPDQSGSASTPPVRPSVPPPSKGTAGPLAARAPVAPLRPRMPKPTPAPAAEPTPQTVDDTPGAVADLPPRPPKVEPVDDAVSDRASPEDGDLAAAAIAKPRLETQRPIAPQPPIAKGPKRRMWIIPVGLGVVVALVAFAAWKLRVRPESVARNTPVVTQPQTETGKIADRVGGAKPPSEDSPAPTPGSDQSSQGQPSQSQPSQSQPRQAPTQPTAPSQTAAPAQTNQQGAPPPSNPELPVAYRAALLVEAPDLPSKVQTFPGTVVWKLNNVNEGPSDAVGLSVEADIDLPDDKTKAVIVFEKNTDPSLPASHTIKVRFTASPGSYSGDIKQISVPQMRREGNSDGEPLAGVTVPVIQNSFLVGLSPGNAETANLRLIADLPWVDIPILLNSGKIAKLTFEKGAAGQRDIAEALSYWQKQ